MHTGHWRSPYSVTVTGADADPTVMPDCGMPSSDEFTAEAACLDAVVPSFGAEPELPLLPLEIAIATPTMITAITTIPPSARTRFWRRARSARARSSARRRARASSFCLVLEAIGARRRIAVPGAGDGGLLRSSQEPNRSQFAC